MWMSSYELVMSQPENVTEWAVKHKVVILYSSVEGWIEYVSAHSH